MTLPAQSTTNGMMDHGTNSKWERGAPRDAPYPHYSHHSLLHASSHHCIATPRSSGHLYPISPFNPTSCTTSHTPSQILHGKNGMDHSPRPPKISYNPSYQHFSTLIVFQPMQCRSHNSASILVDSASSAPDSVLHQILSWQWQPSAGVLHLASNSTGPSSLTPYTQASATCPKRLVWEEKVVEWYGFLYGERKHM